MSTLYAIVRAVPELQGRVYRLLYPGNTPPATPYALVYDDPGGSRDKFYGNADTASSSPCVTIFDKPLAGEVPADAAVRLEAIAAQLENVQDSITLLSSAQTYFIPGSVERGPPYAVLPDKAVSGQMYKTIKYTGLFYRP
jgi:hypothetical protein